MLERYETEQARRVQPERIVRVRDPHRRAPAALLRTGAEGADPVFIGNARARSGPVDIAREIGNAGLIAGRARKRVARVELETRLGQRQRIADLVPVVDDIAGSMERNPYAFLALMRGAVQSRREHHRALSIAALLIALGRQMRLPAAQLREAGLAGLTTHLRTAKPDLNPADGSDTDLLRQAGRICKAYEDMVAGAADGRPLDPAMAIRRLTTTDHDLDTEMLMHFVAAVGIYPVGSFLQLASGTIAVVADQDPAHPELPIVRPLHALPDKHDRAADTWALSDCIGREWIAGIADLAKLDLPPAARLREMLLAPGMRGP